MKKLILASLVLASTAYAADVTILEKTLPATRGTLDVDTRFYIDTDMKEAYANISVNDLVTVYVQDCSGGPYRGPYYPGPRGPRYPYPYPGRFCRTMAQTRTFKVLSDKVKIADVTMNGDDVIYQGTEGDVVCGTMGRSRVLRVPTFYLSGKCSLEGKVVNVNGKNVLTVKFKTK